MVMCVVAEFGNKAGTGPPSCLTHDTPLSVCAAMKHNQCIALLQSLAGTVRHKAYRKRVLSRDVHWSLGDGFEIAVALYAMTHTAVKGAYTYVKAQNNEPLRSETAFICNDTGDSDDASSCLQDGLCRMSQSPKGDCAHQRCLCQTSSRTMCSFELSGHWLLARDTFARTLRTTLWQWQL